jgi:hypothetical protein
LSTPAHDPERILQDIQEWSPGEQFALALAILRRIMPSREEQRGQPARATQATRVPSSALRGLLANGQAAPSDEEVARWLDGARTEKYGS